MIPNIDPNPIIDPIARLLGSWSAEINAASVLFRIALSFVFMAIVGWERARKRHSAGLRTFILVSLASTMSMLLDAYLAAMNHAPFPLVSAATVIGIAIISSNTILYSSKNQIKGLTTAVGLWMCSVIGLSIGGGFYTAAVAGFAVLLICLSRLPKLEIYLKDRSNHFEIHLELKDKHDLQDFITTIRKLGLKIDDIESNPAYINSGLSVFSISLTITGAQLQKYKKHSEIIEALSTLEYVSFIEEIK